MELVFKLIFAVGFFMLLFLVSFSLPASEIKKTWSWRHGWGPMLWSVFIVAIILIYISIRYTYA